MICPICLKKCRTQISVHDNVPEFHCDSMVIPDPPGNREYPHYTKYDVWGANANHYQEEAIILPFKVINYYSNNEYTKPHCDIYKWKYVDNSYGSSKHWTWVKILTFPSILEILPYKKMRNRLKNIVLFS